MVAVIDVYSSIVVDCGDGKRTLGWLIQFWLAVAFILIKCNEDLVPWYLFFLDARLVFFFIGSYC
jgi:hypothetical protein